MVLKISKKAAVFTIMSVLIVGIVLTAFFSLQDKPVDSGIKAIKTRVMTTNRFLDQIDEFAEIAARQALKNSIRKMTEYIYDRGFEANPTTFDNRMKQCLSTNGIHGSHFDCATMEEFFEELEQIGIDKGGFGCTPDCKLEIKVLGNGINQEVMIYQEDAWNLSIEVNFSIYANDGYATYNLSNQTVRNTISILSLPDPVHTLDNPLAPVNYRHLIYTRNVSEWSQNTTLNNYSESGVYFKLSNGVSYLDRIRHDPRPSSCCGIASLVNLSIVNNTGNLADYYEKGNVDFMFYMPADLYDFGQDLYMLDFWQNENESAGRNLNQVRAAIGIEESTGRVLNGTVLLPTVPLETGMPNYTVSGQNYVNLIYKKTS